MAVPNRFTLVTLKPLLRFFFFHFFRLALRCLVDPVVLGGSRDRPRPGKRSFTDGETKAQKGVPGRRKNTPTRNRGARRGRPYNGARRHVKRISRRVRRSATFAAPPGRLLWPLLFLPREQPWSRIDPPPRFKPQALRRLR